MNRSRWLGLCTAVILAACGGQTPSAEHGGAAAKAADAVPPKAFDSPPAVGTRATCPVANEVFTVAADSIRAEHKGKHVVLCCEGCKKPFEADPDKYLGK